MAQGTDYMQEYGDAERAYLQGNYEEAAVIIDRLAGEYDDDPTVQLLRGHIYCYGLQDYSVAREQYERVKLLTDEPDFIDYADNGIADAQAGLDGTMTDLSIGTVDQSYSDDESSDDADSRFADFDADDEATTFGNFADSDDFSNGDAAWPSDEAGGLGYSQNSTFDRNVDNPFATEDEAADFGDLDAAAYNDDPFGMTDALGADSDDEPLAAFEPEEATFMLPSEDSAQSDSPFDSLDDDSDFGESFTADTANPPPSASAPDDFQETLLMSSGELESTFEMPAAEGYDEEYDTGDLNSFGDDQDDIETISFSNGAGSAPADFAFDDFEGAPGADETSFGDDFDDADFVDEAAATSFEDTGEASGFLDAFPEVFSDDIDGIDFEPTGGEIADDLPSGDLSFDSGVLADDPSLGFPSDRG
ncbi:MAG: hypothetical protein HC838_14295 [Spirulinaceae cyanobacterium RM2_2_10]|nr:hypothetical protein [Spirulinaceae cyanobacterium RM2_2_10]